MSTNSIPSPLSVGTVSAVQCSRTADGSAWLLMSEEDGLRYVVSRRWLESAARSPLGTVDREQCLIFARDAQRRGETLVLVGDDDRAAFERGGLDLVLGAIVPFAVPG